MISNLLRTGLLCAGLLSAALSVQADTVQNAVDWAQRQPGTQPQHAHAARKPLVIAHRGASGYVPEHTLAAYALAVLQGADYVEPDLVMTRDGQLVARHDNELGLTTDVAQRPEFAARKRTQTVDGVSLEGWFSEDFTLAELKTLRAIERIPQVRLGNTRFDGQFEIPTLQEIIDLVKSLQLSQQRVIGLYPETKHPTHFQQLGLAMEKPLLAVLKRNGYASGIGPEKGMIIPRDAAGNLTTPTSLVSDAHAARLKVHPYTFRAENAFLPTDLRNGSDPTAHGDIDAELRAFLATGIDGLFIDQPDIAVRLRQQR